MLKLKAEEPAWPKILKLDWRGLQRTGGTERGEFREQGELLGVGLHCLSKGPISLDICFLQLVAPGSSPARM